MGILDFLFGKSKAVEKLDKNTIYQKYYTDYPEKPYISNERNIREWLERAEMFPSQSLVSRNMMVRYKLVAKTHRFACGMKATYFLLGFYIE